MTDRYPDADPDNDPVASNELPKGAVDGSLGAMLAADAALAAFISSHNIIKDSDEPDDLDASAPRSSDIPADSAPETLDAGGNNKLPPRPPVAKGGAEGADPDGDPKRRSDAAADAESGGAIVAENVAAVANEDIAASVVETDGVNTDVCEQVSSGDHINTDEQDHPVIDKEASEVPLHHTIRTYGEIIYVSQDQHIFLPPDPEIVEEAERIRRRFRDRLQENCGIRAHDDFPVASMQEFCIRLGLDPPRVIMFEETPEVFAELKRHCSELEIEILQQDNMSIYEGRLDAVLLPVTDSGKYLKPKLSSAVYELIRGTSTGMTYYGLDQNNIVNLLGLKGEGFNNMCGYQDLGRAALLASTYMQTYQGHQGTMRLRPYTVKQTGRTRVDVVPAKYVYRLTDGKRKGELWSHITAFAAVGIELLVTRGGSVDPELLDAFLYGATSPEGVQQTIQQVNTIEPGLWERMNNVVFGGDTGYRAMTRYIHDRFHGGNPDAITRADDMVSKVMREKLGL